MRKLILRNQQCPGDILMLTAAVRSLHELHPGAFETDVRTPCPGLWEHNPYLTPLEEWERGVEVVDCEYPLIHQSNTRPVHFLEGFTDFLSARLGVRIHPTRFSGDLHLATEEKFWISQVREILEVDVPYWIVVAGGKYDYTTKWWAQERFQAVVDRFRGRLLFVQVGDLQHHHPALRGVLDLRGRTSIRQLVRLMYHAWGVLTPVSFAMHLAAAVPQKPGMPKIRPAVVVAGGREPPHWEAYPGHTFLHTVGALPCCDHGGCWKARVHPLGDGDEKDRPEQLCVQRRGSLPACLDLIRPEDVERAIERYLQGGTAPALSVSEQAAVWRALSA